MSVVINCHIIGLVLCLCCLLAVPVCTRSGMKMCTPVFCYIPYIPETVICKLTKLCVDEHTFV